MPAFDDLIAAAHQTERVLGRRLARRAGIPERQALADTLTRVAGVDGLPALLAARALARQAEAERRAAKLGQRAERLALKQARMQGQAGPATWLAWFDGSARPNPGRIGIGAVLTGPAGERIEISRRDGDGDSGQAEYGALIALLEAAIALRPAELLVRGDSQVVIDDVKRPAAAGAPALAAQRARVGALLAQLEQVTLEWIPRHRNGAADRLARQAFDAGHDEAADAADGGAP